MKADTPKLALFLANKAPERVAGHMGNSISLFGPLAGRARPHYVLGMAITTITSRQIEAASFVVEMASEIGSIVVHVHVPRREGDRIYSDTERSKLARCKAQELAMEFAEALLDDVLGANSAK